MNDVYETAPSGKFRLLVYATSRAHVQGLCAWEIQHLDSELGWYCVEYDRVPNDAVTCLRQARHMMKLYESGELVPDDAFNALYGSLKTEWENRQRDLKTLMRTKESTDDAVLSQIHITNAIQRILRRAGMEMLDESECD